MRSEPLEALVISGWVRGLSDRDIEALLAEALGPEAALSRSTASRICRRLRDDFEAFRQRDLTDVELDYLFLDGSHFKMHDGSRAEPVLVAYGITTLGQPVLVAVEPGGCESHDAWAGFLADLTDRGLRPPLLVISDGAAGLIGAIETTMASALRRRCLIHRCRNVVAKVPAERHDELKTAFLGAPRTARGHQPGRQGPSPRRRPTSTPSPADTSVSSPPPSNACWPTAKPSPPTSGSPQRTGNAYATPTSSNAPSARPDAGSKSSAGSPARPPASPWCGLCSTGPHKAGAASPTPPPSPGTSPSCATDSTNPTTPTTSPTQLSHERPNMTTRTCAPHRYYTKSETRPARVRDGLDAHDRVVSQSAAMMATCHASARKIRGGRPAGCSLRIVGLAAVPLDQVARALEDDSDSIGPALRWKDERHGARNRARPSTSKDAAVDLARRQSGSGDTFRMS